MVEREGGAWPVVRGNWVVMDTGGWYEGGAKELQMTESHILKTESLN